MSVVSDDISSEATGPIGPKFHLTHSWAGGGGGGGGIERFNFFLMKIGSLVWLLWQLRVFTDQNTETY